MHAAAPCPVPVKQQMIEWWGPIIREYYGATEANGFTFCDSEEWLAHQGTVGKPILGELLILDDDGKPCPTGTSGTVWFKGATAFEYFNDPEKTAESRDATGETSTVGDVGYLDDDGYLYLTDRKTYMIISGGVNIYPQETENLLITHPKVMDAAVIGVPNEDLGEEVKAVVQPVAGVEPGPELERELIAFCREHLARFKCPRSIDFEDELPRLPTGKLYKRLLRDRYWEGHTSTIVSHERQRRRRGRRRTTRAQSRQSGRTLSPPEAHEQLVGEVLAAAPALVVPTAADALRPPSSSFGTVTTGSGPVRSTTASARPAATRSMAAGVETAEPVDEPLAVRRRGASGSIDHRRPQAGHVGLRLGVVLVRGSPRPGPATAPRSGRPSPPPGTSDEVAVLLHLPWVQVDRARGHDPEWPFRHGPRLKA